MRTIGVFNLISLDGVMQSPHPDGDAREGFARGGWAGPYQDEVLQKVGSEGARGESALLLGRRTYENFAKVWPHMPADNPFTKIMNGFRKYVASRTLTGPLGWTNSELLEGDAVGALRALKKTRGPNLTVLGSGELVQALLATDLIDELILPIHPLVLGKGRRLFPQDGAAAEFELRGTKTSTTGVIIATYGRRGSA
ncbi:MAG: dihydrofolate reductase [Deltaproteobacteria bacterium]|nr:dihydrofolate reductase [Deltaproteobacteria bacterium]